MVVDLRSPEEVRVDPFRGGLPLPKPPWTPQVQQQVYQMLRTYVPHGTRIGFVCNGGVLSQMAASMMRQAGYNVVDLGAMHHWQTRDNLRKLGFWVDRW
jgi:rhodanese-related sulfurtransferase